MTEITINLPDTLYERIAGFYGQDAVDDFAITALEELTAWKTAEQRPSSMSDLETNRIYAIYQRILKDMLPTADDIGQSFNLPMGRSRYIVQNLSYRHPEFMKRRRIAAIINALALNEVSEDGLPIAIIPKECEDYLVTTAIEMVFARQISSVPGRIKFLDGVRLEMGVNDRDPLLQRLQADLEKLPG